MESAQENLSALTPRPVEYPITCPEACDLRKYGGRFLESKTLWRVSVSILSLSLKYYKDFF